MLEGPLEGNVDFLPSQILKPDPRMVRILRDYDPQLEATFNVINERWTIVRWVPWLRHHGTHRGSRFVKLEMIPWPVLCVQDIDGGYLPLDERVLVLLWEGDLHRYRVKDYCQQREKMVLEAKAKIQRDFEDDIKHLTVESKRQLKKAIEPFETPWVEKTPPPVPMSHERKEIEINAAV